MGKDNFAVEVIAKGSFIDTETGDDRLYLVEAFTLRFNHIALNEWLFSEMMNVRDCYDTDEDWEAHKAEYAVIRETVRAKIIEFLGIDPGVGSVCITQSQSEVFAVVYIRKM